VDAVLLAKIQFGFTAGFHFLFPPTTFGLILIILIFESLYLLKKRHEQFARPLLRVSLIIFIAVSLIQLGLGHAHSVQVAKTQPEKMAAFEALWQTEEGAPFAVFGIPDASNQKTHAYIGIPKFLSVLIHFDPNARVLGLNEFPEDEQPPVFIPFVSYHLMILP